MYHMSEIILSLYISIHHTRCLLVWLCYHNIFVLQQTVLRQISPLFALNWISYEPITDSYTFYNRYKYGFTVNVSKSDIEYVVGSLTIACDEAKHASYFKKIH